MSRHLDTLNDSVSGLHNEMTQLTQEDLKNENDQLKTENRELADIFVRAKIQQSIGPHEDLTTVKRRKPQWYGRVSRSSGLAKTI